MPEELVWPGLVALGVAVGVYGAIIGAGGGFILVPLLILLYPDLSPEVVTAISLGVVFFNATSGTAAFARQRRIDYRAGGLFAASTIPGAVFGALATGELASDAFEAAFAFVLLFAAFLLLAPPPTRINVSAPSPRMRRHMITDSSGYTFVYSFDPWLGAVLGLGIGVLASLFGVGGGIFFVPTMIIVLRFPGHIATATSTFVLMFTAGTGALVHLAAGDYSGVEAEELSLALGVLVGAQAGAAISRLLSQHQEIVARLFSAALVLVAARMLLSALL